jgi:hypothetical protein
MSAMGHPGGRRTHGGLLGQNRASGAFARADITPDRGRARAGRAGPPVTELERDALTAPSGVSYDSAFEGFETKGFSRWTRKP